MKYFPVVLILIILNCTFVFIKAKFSSQVVAKERLMQDLFTNYDSGALPLPPGVKLDLAISFKINHFVFSEIDGSFEFSANLKVEWEDPKLKWALSDYNNVSMMHVQNAVWVPDIELYNSVANKFITMHATGFTWVYNTGRVVWSDRINMKVPCDVNMRYWPYDHHLCNITLGSWTHHGYELDLRIASTVAPVEFEASVENLEFLITNYSASRLETLYECCEEPYITLQYELEFQRRSSIYGILFHIPAICVIMLTLTAFWLEPHRGEKIWLNGISIILIMFNLIYFANNIATFSSCVPFVVIFYCLSFILVTIAMMISCLALTASRSKCNGRVPPGLMKLLKSRVGEILGPIAVVTKRVDQTEMHQQFEDVKLQEYRNLITSDQMPDDWTRVAIVVDRVAFVTYSAIFVLLGTCLL